MLFWTVNILFLQLIPCWDQSFIILYMWCCVSYLYSCCLQLIWLIISSDKTAAGSLSVYFIALFFRDCNNAQLVCGRFYTNIKCKGYNFIWLYIIPTSIVNSHISLKYWYLIWSEYEIKLTDFCNDAAVFMKNSKILRHSQPFVFMTLFLKHWNIFTFHIS